jgi:hypothetical protein
VPLPTVIEEMEGEALGKHTIRGRHVRRGAGVNYPGRVALQLHVLQGSNEAGCIPGVGGGGGATGGHL